MVDEPLPALAATDTAYEEKGPEEPSKDDDRKVRQGGRALMRPGAARQMSVPVCLGPKSSLSMNQRGIQYNAMLHQMGVQHDSDSIDRPSCIGIPGVCTVEDIASDETLTLLQHGASVRVAGGLPGAVNLCRRRLSGAS